MSLITHGKRVSDHLMVQVIKVSVLIQRSTLALCAKGLLSAKPKEQR